LLEVSPGRKPQANPQNALETTKDQVAEEEDKAAIVHQVEFIQKGPADMAPFGVDGLLGFPNFFNPFEDEGAADFGDWV
jgi:hypothetical protein